VAVVAPRRRGRSPPGSVTVRRPSSGPLRVRRASADVAQLVAHHLAKVRVAGSSPVVRSGRRHRAAVSRPVQWPRRWSGREARQRPAKPCTRVRIPSPPRRSQDPAPTVSGTARAGPGVARQSRCPARRAQRAIGAAVARFPDTEEVTGSIPVSPTPTRRRRDRRPARARRHRADWDDDPAPPRAADGPDRAASRSGGAQAGPALRESGSAATVAGRGRSSRSPPAPPIVDPRLSRGG